jgi:predicted ATP-dependent serine protease
VRCRAASSLSAKWVSPAKCGRRRAGQERLKEAAKLGFSIALVPKANAPKKPIEGLTVHPVERVEEAIDIVRGL